jgi:hypothetical protein
VSSNASLSYEAIANARPDPGQVLWFQLYKNKEREKAEARVREVVKLGYRAICLTVDAIVPGNREKDIRAPWVIDDMEKAKDIAIEGSDVEAEKAINIMGTAGALISNDDRDMTWKEVNCMSSDIFINYLNDSLLPDHPVAKKYHDFAHRDKRYSVCSGKFYVGRCIRTFLIFRPGRSARSRSWC